MGVSPSSSTRHVVGLVLEGGWVLLLLWVNCNGMSPTHLHILTITIATTPRLILHNGVFSWDL